MLPVYFKNSGVSRNSHGGNGSTATSKYDTVSFSRRRNDIPSNRNEVPDATPDPLLVNLAPLLKNFQINLNHLILINGLMAWKTGVVPI
jgi:hypothetical protein